MKLTSNYHICGVKISSLNRDKCSTNGPKGRGEQAYGPRLFGISLRYEYTCHGSFVPTSCNMTVLPTL